MTWGFIWLMVILKIPVFGLLYIVWWSVRQSVDEEPVSGDDGGLKRPPLHPRPRLPRPPRRGPHGVPEPASPSRVRTVVARARVTR